MLCKQVRLSACSACCLAPITDCTCHAPTNNTPDMCLPQSDGCAKSQSSYAGSAVCWLLTPVNSGCLLFLDAHKKWGYFPTLHDKLGLLHVASGPVQMAAKVQLHCGVTGTNSRVAGTRQRPCKSFWLYMRCWKAVKGQSPCHWPACATGYRWQPCLFTSCWSMSHVTMPIASSVALLTTVVSRVWP